MKLYMYMFILGLSTGFSKASYVGPTVEQPVVSVESIKKNPIDDSKVVVQGYITHKLADDRYKFSDETGNIIVEIDDDEFPARSIDERTLVRISGEIDISNVKEPEIDADEVIVVN